MLGVFYLNVLPGWLGLPGQSLHVSFADIAVTVVVFLGVPLIAGFLTRTLGERARGREWYETRLGEYRALYTVDDQTRTVTVLAVAHPRDAYRPR